MLRVFFKNNWYPISILVLMVALLAYYKYEGRNAISPEQVNVYSSRKDILTRQLFDQFTKETKVKVNVIIDKAPVLISRIQSEGQSSPADVFLTSDIANLELAKQKGLLARISTPVIKEQVAPAWRDEQDYWLALSKRARVIVVSKERLPKSQWPTTYMDLAKPEYQGKILIRSSQNVYNQSLIASLIAQYGMDEARTFVKSLVNNFARTPQGGDTDQLRAIAAGVGDVAVVNSYYIARLMDSSNPEDKAVADAIEVIFPNQQATGAHVNISGAGVVKTSAHRINALKLLEFLTSPQAQAIYAQVNHEFPVHDQAKLSDIVANWANFKQDVEALKKLPVYLQSASTMALEEGWR